MALAATSDAGTEGSGGRLVCVPPAGAAGVAGGVACAVDCPLAAAGSIAPHIMASMIATSAGGTDARGRTRVPARPASRNAPLRARRDTEDPVAALTCCTCHSPQQCDAGLVPR